MTPGAEACRDRPRRSRPHRSGAGDDQSRREVTGPRDASPGTPSPAAPRPDSPDRGRPGLQRRVRSATLPSRPAFSRPGPGRGSRGAPPTQMPGGRARPLQRPQRCAGNGIREKRGCATKAPRSWGEEAGRSPHLMVAGLCVRLGRRRSSPLLPSALGCSAD